MFQLVGILGRFLGGVRARGEFLIVIRNDLSYTILEPPGDEDKDDMEEENDDEDDDDE